jgi:hypothetical protein
MKTQVTRNQSLLANAFDVLLRNLGPQKTSQLWQLLIPSQTDYASIRQKLFKGKGIDSLYREAKKFNKK